MTAVVVTGMHRSGTSLVANVLHHAGINMGDDLLPADVGNRHGYYEDALIHDVHIEMMRAAGISDAFTVMPGDLPLKVEGAAAERAQGVIAARSGQERWGWKEPRSALFLDLWNDLVPDARFVFCVRDPTLVLDSLIRRASQASINQQPWVALDVWYCHTSEMRAFSDRFPERCVWLDAEAVISNVEGLVRSVAELTGFDLDGSGLERLLAKDDYHTKPRMRSRLVERKHAKPARRAHALYEEIRERTL